MLSCETQEGKEYIANENDIAETICAKFKCKQILMAQNNTQVDRLFYRDNQLVAIGEIKSRNLSLQKLKSFGSYLISHSKIKTGSAFSALVGVPYFLFVKLLEDNDIFFWKVCDEKGDFLVKYDVERTQTKRNIFGGQVNRENAFLSLNEMQKLET